MALRIPSLSPTSWVTVQNLFAQFFALALFAIQAPLLGPKAFGLITIVMIFIGFCEAVLEIAATDALISVREIGPEHYATMTTVNALIASTLGFIAFAFAHQISNLFREPELESILHWMAMLPLVSALATAPNAASRREMQFRPLALRVLVSTIAGGAVGLTLTLLHFGVWALVWQAIVQRVVNVVVLWRLVDLPFRLGLSRPHLRELYKFGGPMLIAQTMTWGGAQLPRFIFGLYLGASDLGLFALASRLQDLVVLLTVSPRYGVARVEMRAFIDNRGGLDTVVKRLLVQMAFLCFPVCIGGAVIMPLLFKAWLDTRWSGGVVVAQVMLLGAMPYVTHYALSAVLLGMNRQGSIAVNSAVQAAATVMAVWLCAPFGLLAMSAAIALRPLATAILPIAFAHLYCGISRRSVVWAQVPVLLTALIMGLAIWALRTLLANSFGGGVLLCVIVVAGGAMYAILSSIFLPEFVSKYTARLSFLLKR
jgi:O-antigen/teichoic acid export membrane protein